MNFLANLIPPQFRLLAGICAIVFCLASLAGVAYKIHSAGYDSCELKYEKKAQQAKDEARKNILALEKKYDAIKNQISSKPDSGYGVGPAVEYAIDRMPVPPAGRGE